MAPRAHVVRTPPPPTSPNYYLLLLGMGLAAGLLCVYLVSHNILPPPLQALLIAGSMVLILYGIYPVPAIEGTFGRLYVAGPAALGLFLFLFVWKSLAVTTDNKFFVLENLNPSRLPDGTTITLLDVDSLSDKELTPALNKARQAIARGGIDQKEIDQILADFYQRIINSLDFGDKYADARAVLSNPHQDQAWANLIEAVSQQSRDGKSFLKKIKRQPFAIVQVKGSSNRVDLVLPGVPLQVGQKSYRVPIMANPALDVTRGIQEAIVLQLEE